MTVVNIRYENGERRKIGWIEGETFFSPRKPSKHLFRGGRSTVKEARRDGCQPGDLIVRSVKD